MNGATKIGIVRCGECRARLISEVLYSGTCSPQLLKKDVGNG